MIDHKKKISSLYQAYQDYFLIGAAVNPVTIDSQKQLLLKHFNSLTSENHMKFENIHPAENEYTFKEADRLMVFAQEHEKQVRGHTLVWHNQTPEWMFTNRNREIVDRKQLLERMKAHISTVVNRYKGQIYSWDVVNEAVSDTGDQLLRNSKWVEIIGEDFIENAFIYAHLADPNAALFYNDYNESNPDKREKIYTLVKRLVEREVPIHGIGLQAHWNVADPTYDNIKRAIESYASLGLQIQITEMDVSVFNVDDKRTDLLQPTDEMKALQTERYQRFFEIFRAYRDVITSVTFWGGADDYTWLDNFPVKGRKNWPFVFDKYHQPKEAFWKIIDFQK